MSHTALAKWAALLARIAPDGLVMEFGVAEGASLRRIAGLLPGRMVYGFDSFEGLPEDWRSNDGQLHNPRGAFACAVPQDLPPNVELIIGLFQDTLPAFISAHDERVSFVHIDCDLYSSTMFVLRELRSRLQGAILVFDEFRGERPYEQHEGRAWREFIQQSGCQIEELERMWAKGASFRVVTSAIGVS